MFDREKVVDELVESDMEYFGIASSNSAFRSWKRTVFSALTDEQLMEECEDRDISYLFGEDDDA